MDVLKLPFDQYQRYKIIQEAVDIIRDGNRCLKILDVGGHPGPAIGFFPGDEVTILDKEECDIPQYKKADALSLPFSDRSFDVVISADTLEHISTDKREIFLKELCRVSREFLCIAAPFDNPQVHEAERILFEFIKAKLGYEHHFLHDHLDYGLPHIERTLKSLRESLGDVIILPNGNLSRWLPMMMIEFYFDIDDKYKALKGLTNEYYNTYYYRMDNSEPCYRYLVVAGKEDRIRHFKSQMETLLCMPEDIRTVDFSIVSTIIELTNLDLLGKANKEIQKRDEMIWQRDEQIRNKNEQIQWMINSKSWRITAPLRKIENLLRDIYDWKK